MLKKIGKDEWYPMYMIDGGGRERDVPDDLITRHERAVQEMFEVNDLIEKIYEQSTTQRHQS